jgi:tetratricopeptide (TPR) repeat protein
MWHRKLITALGLCLVVASTALPQQEEWNELDQEAMKIRRQGKSAEAIAIGQHALEFAEKTFGPNHANVAKSLDNLAWLYRDQKKYAEAEPLFKSSLAIREKALGPEHPKVGRSLSHLAEVYRKTGKAEEASQLEERAKGIKYRSGSR